VSWIPIKIVTVANSGLILEVVKPDRRTQRDGMKEESDSILTSQRAKSHLSTTLLSNLDSTIAHETEKEHCPQKPEEVRIRGNHRSSTASMAARYCVCCQRDRILVSAAYDA